MKALNGPEPSATSIVALFRQPGIEVIGTATIDGTLHLRAANPGAGAQGTPVTGKGITAWVDTRTYLPVRIALDIPTGQGPNNGVKGAVPWTQDFTWQPATPQALAVFDLKPPAPFRSETADPAGPGGAGGAGRRPAGRVTAAGAIYYSAGRVSATSLFLNTRDRRHVPAGEIVYSEGEVGTHMYGVVDGAVELRKGSIVVASLGPNDVFGERALIDNHARDLTAVAVTDTTLVEMDRYLFLFLVDESPRFALDIMGALASRLRDYDNQAAAAGGAAG